MYAATMPMLMTMEVPWPIPTRVISSAIHMRHVVPAASGIETNSMYVCCVVLCCAGAATAGGAGSWSGRPKGRARGLSAAAAG